MPLKQSYNTIIFTLCHTIICILGGQKILGGADFAQKSLGWDQRFYIMLEAIIPSHIYCITIMNAYKL